MYLRPLLPDDEPRILKWRNHPDVARFMYRDTPISAEEHAAWFASACADSDEAVHRIALLEGAPVGVSSLTQIDYANSQCEWGGYLAPDVFRGQGLGRQMLEAALSMAFVDLGMQRVFVEVITTNQRAHALYRAVGFELVETIHGRVIRSTGPIDVHRMVASRPEDSRCP